MDGEIRRDLPRRRGFATHGDFPLQPGFIRGHFEQGAAVRDVPNNSWYQEVRAPATLQRLSGACVFACRLFRGCAIYIRTCFNALSKSPGDLFPPDCCD